MEASNSSRWHHCVVMHRMIFQVLIGELVTLYFCIYKGILVSSHIGRLVTNYNKKKVK